MLVQRRVTPGIKFAVPIYTPKNTTQCPRPGFEPGQLDPESSALTMRPPLLPFFFFLDFDYYCCFSSKKIDMVFATFPLQT